MFACDSYGGAWYRYGVTAPAADSAFPPAWVRLEDLFDKRAEETSTMKLFKKPLKKANSLEAACHVNDARQQMAPLIQIAVGGADDQMVWAIDSKHGLHCRKGVTTDLPIGTEWVRVSRLWIGKKRNNNKIWKIERQTEKQR